MKKKRDKGFEAFAKKWKLDEEEQDLLRAFESGEMRPAKDSKELITASRMAARRYFEKKARLNIRVTAMDLSKLKRRAALEGLPYQTLAASILHKYVSGMLTPQ